MKLKIIEIRKAKGLSQTDLAQRLGSTLSMVGKLERGERKMTVQWLERIGQALSVDPQSLIDASDEPINAGILYADGSVRGSEGVGATVTLPIPQSGEVDEQMSEFDIDAVGASSTRRQLRLCEDVNIRVKAGAHYIYSQMLRPRDALGKLVLAALVDDDFERPQALHYRVGVVLKGSLNCRYHLLTLGGDLMEDVYIGWTAPIEAIKI